MSDGSRSSCCEILQNAGDVFNSFGRKIMVRKWHNSLDTVQISQIDSLHSENLQYLAEKCLPNSVNHNVKRFE